MKTNYHDEILLKEVVIPPEGSASLSGINGPTPRMFNGYPDETKARFFYPLRCFLKGDLDDLDLTAFFFGSETIINTSECRVLPARVFAEGLEEPDLPMPTIVQPDITISLCLFNPSKRERSIEGRIVGIGVTGRIYRECGP
jgi:hypothetical protein